ncbi:hypothetical protein F53441_5404 [Fusarium austroafricanum]|uniref:Uncharacterized protein n=1 Tax=Fusarium austroafricanum TaxID=2364996 RepID=A0A8H4NXT3_9HYPO|nr:hypothetical protein F53441_5404 [Fusarium austroafricanum]
MARALLYLRKVFVSRKIESLIGALPWVWLGDLSPPTWGSSCLEKLSIVLHDATQGIVDDNEFSARVEEVKQWLRRHAKERTNGSDRVTIMYFNINAAWCQRIFALNREQSCREDSFDPRSFTVEHINSPPGPLANRNEIGEAAPASQFISSSNTPQKRRALKSIHSGYAYKVPRLSRSSSPASISTVVSVRDDTSKILNQWHNNLRSEICSAFSNVTKLHHNIEQDLERADQGTRLPNLITSKEHGLKKVLESVSREGWGKTATDAQAACDKTTRDIRAKEVELRLAERQLEKLTVEYTQIKTEIGDQLERRDMLNEEAKECTEYMTFIEKIGQIFDAGSKGMKKLMRAMTGKGVDFEALVLNESLEEKSEDAEDVNVIKEELVVHPDNIQ